MQGKPSCMVLQAICGLSPRSWHREMAQVTSSVQGGRDMRAGSPGLALAPIILLLGKWLKSEAKCHIVRPLKSGLKGKGIECQSVHCSQSTRGP